VESIHTRFCFSSPVLPFSNNHGLRGPGAPPSVPLNCPNPFGPTRLRSPAPAGISTGLDWLLAGPNESESVWVGLAVSHLPGSAVGRLPRLLRASGLRPRLTEFPPPGYPQPRPLVSGWSNRDGPCPLGSRPLALGAVTRFKFSGAPPAGCGGRFISARSLPAGLAAGGRAGSRLTPAADRLG
jgi:hypothetical protein